MHTTVQLLDEIRAKLQLRSDYAVSRYMGVTPMTVVRWRSGGNFSDENAIKVADILGLPRPYVLACMGAERSAEVGEASGVWRQIAGAFHHTVALWLLTVACFSAGILTCQDASALAVSFYKCTLCKVTSRWRVRRVTVLAA